MDTVNACGGWRKGIHMPILVGDHHSTDLWVLLMEAVKIDWGAHRGSSPAVFPVIFHKHPKWRGALWEGLCHVKEANPHPHAFSAGWMAVGIQVHFLRRISGGIANPVPPLNRLIIILVGPVGVEGVLQSQCCSRLWKQANDRSQKAQNAHHLRTVITVVSCLPKHFDLSWSKLKSHT